MRSAYVQALHVSQIFKLQTVNSLIQILSVYSRLLLLLLRVDIPNMVL